MANGDAEGTAHGLRVLRLYTYFHHFRLVGLWHDCHPSCHGGPLRLPPYTQAALVSPHEYSNDRLGQSQKARAVVVNGRGRGVFHTFVNGFIHLHSVSDYLNDSLGELGYLCVVLFSMVDF